MDISLGYEYFPVCHKKVCPRIPSFWKGTLMQLHGLNVMTFCTCLRLVMLTAWHYRRTCGWLGLFYSICDFRGYIFLWINVCSLHLLLPVRRKRTVTGYLPVTCACAEICGFSRYPKQRLIRYVIRPPSLNALGRTWKWISLPDIRDMSALEVSPFHGIAPYKSTFTYLLTRRIALGNRRPRKRQWF